MERKARQIAINIIGGVSKSILVSIAKQGDTNVLDRHRPQCYTAFIVICGR